ncbi:hypothetical protein MMC31_007009 [Peltigera leucophlebia]|nr:hypothetical protein [Peltigera leucophlebia]
MDANATDEATRLELDVGREDPGQSRAVTRQMSLEVHSSQASILQPVSGSGAGRKAKGKAEARHGGKERPSSITALKLIAKQGADEKAQLEEWKAELMAILASEIKQLQDAHGEAVEGPVPGNGEATGTFSSGDRSPQGGVERIETREGRK